MGPELLSFELLVPSQGCVEEEAALQGFDERLSAAWEELLAAEAIEQSDAREVEETARKARLQAQAAESAALAVERAAAAGAAATLSTEAAALAKITLASASCMSDDAGPEPTRIDNSAGVGGHKMSADQIRIEKERQEHKAASREKKKTDKAGTDQKKLDRMNVGGGRKTKEKLSGGRTGGTSSSTATSSSRNKF